MIHMTLEEERIRVSFKGNTIDIAVVRDCHFNLYISPATTKSEKSIGMNIGYHAVPGSQSEST